MNEGIYICHTEVHRPDRWGCTYVENGLFRSALDPTNTTRSPFIFRPLIETGLPWTLQQAVCASYAENPYRVWKIHFWETFLLAKVDLDASTTHLETDRERESHNHQSW
jgi:hypothetical protein